MIHTRRLGESSAKIPCPYGTMKGPRYTRVYTLTMLNLLHSDDRKRTRITRIERVFADFSTESDMIRADLPDPRHPRSISRI